MVCPKLRRVIMGGTTYNPKAWDSYTRATVSGKSASAIFTTHGLKPAYDPKGIIVRESRDSVVNPNSSAIAVFLDVTGSMGIIAETMARDGLKTLIEEIHARKPVTDPHIMVGAIGDVATDTAPLQCGQYEGGLEILEQLIDLYIEGNGGGNQHESYTLPWYFAAMHTSLDCFEKRSKKGYLFTIGDEPPPSVLTSSEVEKVFGVKSERDFTSEELLLMVEKSYHVFHIMVEQGSHMRHSGAQVKKAWTNLLGQRALLLSDHTKLAEIIVSTIQVIEGESVADVVSSWPSDNTSLVVSRAIGGLSKDVANPGSGGLVRF